MTAKVAFGLIDQDVALQAAEAHVELLQDTVRALLAQLDPIPADTRIDKLRAAVEAGRQAVGEAGREG